MGWFRSLFKKDKFPGLDYQFTEAFTVAGRTFYEMDAMVNIPYERGVICLRFYEEMNQRVDREYLIEHTKAVANLCKLYPGKPVDLNKIEQLNANLGDRLNWIIDTDLAYKLASVVYFDKHEHPAKYDFKYNDEKIEFWKKHMSAKEFFFMQPLIKLIPFLKEFEGNFETYQQVTAAVKEHYQKEVSKQLSVN